MRSPLLMLFGTKHSIFGAPWRKAYRTWSWLWKVPTLRKIERPATNCKDHNSLTRLTSTTTEELWKTWKFNSLLLELSKTSKLWNFHKTLLRRTLKLLYLGNEPIVQRTSNIPISRKNYQYSKKPTNYNSIIIILNKTNCQYLKKLTLGE